MWLALNEAQAFSIPGAVKDKHHAEMANFGEIRTIKEGD